MRIDILTVVPELLTSPLNESILHRAQEKGLVRIVVHNLHDYANVIGLQDLPANQRSFNNQRTFSG